MLNPATTQLLSKYWGKADPTAAQQIDHHTVLGHSLDVAACTFSLVNLNPILAGQLSDATGIEKRHVALTFATICALHDIGKLDTRFQRKAAFVADVIRPESIPVAAGKYDHGEEGFLQLEDDEVLLGLVESTIGPAATALLRAVCGHHGAFPQSGVDPDGSRSLLPRSLRVEDESARRSFAEVLLDFFRHEGAVFPWPGAASGALVQRVGGLCAIADWLGSNVAFFPYQNSPCALKQYWADALERAAKACDQTGLIRANVGPINFGRLFPGYRPRDIQVVTESLQLNSPALIIVEAEMGKGKTEAALSLAARYMAAGTADGVTVALPTMATSNAMFGRVEAWAPKAFEGGDVQVALAHGRARRMPRFQKLLEGPLHARDADATEASVTCARWFLSRKRILLAQVGVGTIDQALQAALSLRHQFVRMFGLSRNVLIIDEVHAYDVYMEVLLEHLLAWLGALNVPVILLSATLPSERRAALCAAWSGENAIGQGDDLQSAKGRAYPLVTVATHEGTKAFPHEVSQSARVIRLEHVSRQDEALHVTQTVARLIAAAQSGARIGWIRNTVREAQVCFRELQEKSQSLGIDIKLFHARFRGCDRSEIEADVLRDFGKTAPPGGRILIATQVIEQSLDLDFDELHTDLAPIDLVFQRMGRLHRHDRHRLPGFQKPCLVLHAPSSIDIDALKFGGSGFVYDPVTLWITSRTLRGRNDVALPTDIRSLVEEVYHPQSREAHIQVGGEKLADAEAKLREEIVARQTKAKRCCIPPYSADPTGGGSLDDSEEAVQAFTRDGESTTILPFWWDGNQARNLFALPEEPFWNLDAEAPDAGRLAGDLLDQTLSVQGNRSAEPAVANHGWLAWKKRFSNFSEDAGLGGRLVPLPMERVGDQFEGTLVVFGKPRSVVYTREMGLFIQNSQDEEQLP